jgi:hypothetical protein
MITGEKVDAQRKLVFENTPKVELVNPCSIQNGILRISKEDERRFSSQFLHAGLDSSFFIPASGSGSRMFEFLYDFFKHSDEENRMKVERFLNHINDFAFCRMVDPLVKLKLDSGEMNLKEFASYIVEESGLGFGNLPKGLIPFHTYDYFVLNPFQEHVLQICKSFTDHVKIHFTVNYDYLDEIKDSIRSITQISAFQPEVHFSEQSKATDSLVFFHDGTLVVDEQGQPQTRPAGHGALLENMNNLDSRFIFIKNIDNIQHLNNDHSASVYATLGGVLLELNLQLKQIWDAAQDERFSLLSQLNIKYNMFYREDLIPNQDEEIEQWLLRPKRVCGMVKNEGQPGGGPFWVKRNGKIEKQIVEKAQIAHDSEQMMTLVKSTHFNPVFLACDVHDFEGNKFDLNDYQDASTYMVVDKKMNGTNVRFVERPGLWNGGMADWITVFVEIPSEAFSPVKDVLNLLDNKHLGL